ncbi:MAG: L-histidine N(alpha)-methyltransferase [Oceanococcus sp.]
MNSPAVLDRHPVATAIQQEILLGLRQAHKHLPSKYLYDARGAQLFEQICELPEYYPTRTEIEILKQALPKLAQNLGPNRWVVEPGSGSGQKTLMLLDSLNTTLGYVPIDISKAQLKSYAAQLQLRYPALKLRPVCADFMGTFARPDDVENPMIWFPGSTIGNLSHEHAAGFLRKLAQWTQGQGDLLIGVDLVKPIEVLEAAYDDAAGVTAQFNLNLLAHLNRAADCNFDTAQFQHRASWNPQLSAIQMFLQSQCQQQVCVGEECIQLRENEAICTEYSHKYTPETFQILANKAGWKLQSSHLDEHEWFGVFHFSLN